MDSTGKAVLASSIEHVCFQSGPMLEKIGIDIKRVKVMFHNENGMKVGYTDSIDLGVSSVSVRGSFDLVKLITACSGLLCKTA